MSRSIFEDVTEADVAARPTTRAGAADAEKRRNRHVVAWWLLVLAMLVVVQVVVGGLTRLTDSGLSMTEWRLQGFAPPLSQSDWESEFAKYQTTTEFKEINSDMTLEEFKTIYWWEWGHRSWGRVIGLAFILPFAFFAVRGMIPSGWTGRILFVGALGGLQGLIGWWMVVSGLASETDVSQYRLALHLSLAFVIIGLLLWYALSLRRDEWELLQARRRREKGLFIFTSVLATLIFLQIIIGAFVAGLRAWDYGDWPTMGGAFFPPGEPFIPLEEKAATQFVHRKLAYLLIIVMAIYWWVARRSAFAKTRLWSSILAGVVALQVLIGIAALVKGVPIVWGSLHQTTAVLLFAVLIHAKHQVAFPREERIASTV